MKLSLGTLQFRICSHHQKPSQLPAKPARPILKTNIINHIIIYIPLHLQTPTRKLWGSPWPCGSEPRDQNLLQADVSRLLLFQGWNLRKPAAGTVWSATGQHWINVPTPPVEARQQLAILLEKKQLITGRKDGPVPFLNLSTAPLLQEIIKHKAKLPAPGLVSQARDGATNNYCGLWVWSFHCIQQSKKVFCYGVHISETLWHDRSLAFYLMPHNYSLVYKTVVGEQMDRRTDRLGKIIYV